MKGRICFAMSMLEETVEWHCPFALRLLVMIQLLHGWPGRVDIQLELYGEDI